MSELFLKALIVIGCALSGIATTLVFKMKRDNAIEEAMERVIEKHTNMLIDLSPQDGKDPDESEDKEEDS